MGFWEWTGLKKARPDYREASQRYRQMLDLSDLEAGRSTAIQDWRGMQERAFGDITSRGAREWGQTGATGLGIESSIPGQRAGEAASRWMQETGAPAFRGIESAYAGEKGRRKTAATEALFYEREKAQAEAKAKTGAGLPFLGKIAGAAASFIPGVGPILGPAIMGLSGGLGGGGGGNWNMNPQAPWNQGNGQQGMPQGFDMGEWEQFRQWRQQNQQPWEYRPSGGSTNYSG